MNTKAILLKIPIFIALALLTSCNSRNLSPSDKLFIETQISLHNAGFGLDYKLNEIGRESKLKAALYKLSRDTAIVNKQLDSIRKEYQKEDAGKKYDPRSDPDLTDIELTLNTTKKRR